MSDGVAGYRNPVIPGFHPDPSVCRAGAEYYLATSSFTYFPGAPIFRSSNLVDWTQIGNALDRPSQLDLGATTRTAFGMFAPTLRAHADRFWLITTNFNRGRADNMVVTTADPAGAWSEPVHLPLPGIDPDLAWDRDGTCWVHFSSGSEILRARVDIAAGTVLDGPEPTWSGTGLQYPEAPHLFRRDGAWYLLIAEGGTERGHAVSIARGPSPIGPWEPCPANPIVSHRSTARPIQNTGHADLVEAPDGSWWMVLLGTRPRGATPGFHVLGRETFLAPVTWIDGWPNVEPIELEVAHRPPGPPSKPVVDQRDDFDGADLDPRWIAVRVPPSTFTSLAQRPGWLTLHGGEHSLDSSTPAFLGRRQQYERSRTGVLVDPGASDEAGLAVYIDRAFHYEIAIRRDLVVAHARIGPLASVVAEAVRPAEHVVLWIETRDHRIAPDTVVLGFDDADGTRRDLAELDGRFLATEVASGMTGRVIGVYAIGGDAAFDWFDHRAHEVDAR
jgi:beta-xylosidase